MDRDLKSRFATIVGERHALDQAADIAPYIEDTRGRWNGTSSLVLRPGSVAEVSAILALATQTRTPVIPQGGNTGLVGAGLPWLEGGGREVILSLGRMNRVLDVDGDTNTMVVEAGCVLETIQKAAEEADRLFPLSLGSQGSCQIGGNISSNAGGTAVLAYGNTRDLVMGLEAVLPSGAVWNGLSRLRKDNTGYDLKNLLVGAEGTLGVVTKAVLKLFPRPRGREVAYVAVQSPNHALKLLNRAKATVGNGLTGFEFM
ncbi:MAG: FAD-binding oxidoreductase, partial [Pseudomonadota bacterium]